MADRDERDPGARTDPAGPGKTTVPGKRPRERPVERPAERAAERTGERPGERSGERSADRDAPPDDDTERRRRRAQFLRELNEARELRDRVQPRRARAARMRQQMRMRTFRW
ncbi:hypothetical protein [Streptomyces sp. I05A-00742]|uniref:hypothetical protein n=1 Tax=Streptomyces sp. I05A-00742 TaxID=2732853 RepID=UPI001487BD18